MIGKKSITKQLLIVNKNNPKEPFKVLVQANKNFGIIEIQPRISKVFNEFQGRQINSESTMEHLKNVLTETLNTL